MTVAEWLNTNLYRDKPKPTVLERLAELVFCNNGLVVRGWGITSHGGGPYGRLGLEQEEALELIELKGVLDGFALAIPGSHEIAAVMVQAEIERVGKLSEELTGVTS